MPVNDPRQSAARVSPHMSTDPVILRSFCYCKRREAYAGRTIYAPRHPSCRAGAWPNEPESHGGRRDRKKRAHHRRGVSPPLRRPPRGAQCTGLLYRGSCRRRHVCDVGALLSSGTDPALYGRHPGKWDRPCGHWLPGSESESSRRRGASAQKRNHCNGTFSAGRMRCSQRGLFSLCYNRTALCGDEIRHDRRRKDRLPHRRFPMDHQPGGQRACS